MATATAKRKTARKTSSKAMSGKVTTRKAAAASPAWGGIGDAAVKKATGCGWDRWITALDREGCRDMTHKQIAALVHRKWPKVGGWWSQMVTVGYEQAHGLRSTNQASTGVWQVSSTRTVAVPVKTLFQAWSDPRKRAAWLKDHCFTVRKQAAPKSMRITWVDGASSVEANFYAKGARKSSVALQHSKLSGKAEVARMRAYWAKALEALKARLER